MPKQAVSLSNQVEHINYHSLHFGHKLTRRERSTYVHMRTSCCLAGSECWSAEVMVMLSGLLPNPKATISMMGITSTVHNLCYLATVGIGAATSTRVAQSLGAGEPGAARLSISVRDTCCCTIHCRIYCCVFLLQDLLLFGSSRTWQLCNQGSL